ncbi:hypothetical protein BVG16_13640 [Paenibacillus selenitireducens]|uniref:Uncharacterized protein n=1 Tax=Paenibacillus selenitireducens TaxID=1324314 RepID=A0A1T2XCJ1_9BACL|nr:hypothetical protein [Paenibacillus selenitireducens]OPA77492.1 hypothetical protein BVG16_13640 [Paenibacillus selenitireducens]
MEATQLIDVDIEESVIGIGGFEWKSRVSCVEKMASVCIERKVKFDEVLGAINFTSYCSNPLKMTKKQLSMLKRDVNKRVKDLQHEKMVPEVGDQVRVPKLVKNQLLGGYVQDGRNLVEAIVISQRKMTSGYHYKVKRVADGEIQEGNGHMIKEILTKRE